MLSVVDYICMLSKYSCIVKAMAFVDEEDGVLTNEEKAELMKLLEKVEFASCSVGYYCSHCCRLMLTQWQLPCSHNICRNCLSTLDQDDVTCYLHQRTFHRKQVRHMVDFEKDLAKLRVFCVKRAEGCPDSFSLKRILKHIERCPHPIDKLQLVKQKLDLPDKTTWNEKWEEFISPMKTSNSIAIEKESEEEENIDEHQFIRCLRKIQEETLDEISQSKDDGVNRPFIRSDSNENNELTDVVTSKNGNRVSFSLKMGTLEVDGQVDSKWFNVTFDGKPLAKFRFMVEKDDNDYVLFSVCFRYFNKRNERLRYQRVTLSIQMQGKRTITRVEEPCFASDGWPLIVAFEPINMSLLRSNIIRWEVNVDIEPLITLYDPISVKCKWTIDDMKEKLAGLRDGSCSCLRSPYFFSAKPGYRMQATIRLNGDYLSAYLDFLVGEWDQKLPHHFQHSTTFVAKWKKGLVIAEEHVYGDEHLFGDRIDNFISMDTIEGVVCKDNRSIVIQFKVKSIED